MARARGKERKIGRRSGHAALVLVTLATLIAIGRIHTYHEPLERDLAAYAVVAREIRLGQPLYAGIWDHKPPAIHLVFAAAQIVAGTGPLSVYVLGVAMAVATLIAVFIAVRRATGSAGAALLGAAFWTAISGDMMLQANQPNTEVFINACLAGVFALMVPHEDRVSPSRGAVSGAAALLALASLFKHVAAAAGLPMLLAALFVTQDEPRPVRRRLADAGLVLAVLAGAWLAVDLWFRLAGTHNAYREAVFTYNRAYASDLVSNLREVLSRAFLVPSAVRFLWPLAALTLAGCVAGVRTGAGRWLTLGTWIAGTWAAVALPAQFLPHYYQLWLAPLAVGAGMGVAALAGTAFRYGRPLAFTSGGAALALLLAHTLPAFSLSPEEIAVRKYQTDRWGAVREEGRALGSILRENEALFAWDEEPGLYLYSGRRPGASFIYVSPFVLWLWPGGEARLIARLEDELTARSPELILREDGFPFPPGLGTFVAERYTLRPFPKTQETSYTLEHWVRKGGPLAERLSR